MESKIKQQQSNKYQSCTYIPSSIPSMTPSKTKDFGRDMLTIFNLKLFPIKIWDFDYNTLKWSNPRIKGIEVGEEIGSGGFRLATKVTIEGKDFVSKSYLDSSKEVIEGLNMSIEAHAIKSVQMKIYASYLTTNFNEKNVEKYF